MISNRTSNSRFWVSFTLFTAISPHDSIIPMMNILPVQQGAIPSFPRPCSRGWCKSRQTLSQVDALGPRHIMMVFTSSARSSMCICVDDSQTCIYIICCFFHIDDTLVCLFAPRINMDVNIDLLCIQLHKNMWFCWFYCCHKLYGCWPLTSQQRIQPSSKIHIPRWLEVLVQISSCFIDWAIQ